MQCGINRDVKDDDAATHQGLAERLETTRGEAQSGHDEREADRHPTGHTQRLADPAVVEGEFDEVTDTEDDSRDPRIQQPATADELFEVEARARLARLRWVHDNRLK